MAGSDGSTRMGKTVSGHTARPGDNSESKLDSLFEGYEREQARVQTPAAPSPDESARLDQLRSLFQGELTAAFNELREKYAERGVRLILNADGFIQGGRDVVIEIEFQGVGKRLTGVVVSGTIAFNQTHYSASDTGGVTATGPALRTRSLDSAAFRNFVCEQMTALVQAVLKKKG